MTARRMSAALLALAVAATLFTRIGLNMDQNDVGLGAALWAIFRYFTIWTNTLIGFAAAGLALGGRLDGRISAGLLLAITAVGGVYHLLLASLTDFQGVEAVIDTMLHTVVPIWFALQWVFFEPKARLRFADIPLWLAYPALYCLYALVRAGVDGVYPYPFLDIGKNGVAAILVNMAGLLLAFAGLGALIVWVARLMTRIWPQGSTAT